MRIVLLLLAMLFQTGVALAQGGAPGGAADTRIASTEDRTPRRLPTTGYTLALSWTPEYCHARRGAAECRLPSAHGFTLHGLWPDGADPKVWPQYCRTTQPLTPAQIRAGQAATPSARLLQHEWDKHGTCMTADPSAYFAEEQRLYRGIRAPDMRALSARRGLTARQVQQSFAAANPGMTADMVRLNLNRRGWLEEVWVCLGRDKRPQRCPAGSGGPASGDAVRVQRP